MIHLNFAYIQVGCENCPVFYEKLDELYEKNREISFKIGDCGL